MVFPSFQPAHGVQLSAFVDDVTAFRKDQRDADAISRMPGGVSESQVFPIRK